MRDPHRLLALFILCSLGAGAPAQENAESQPTTAPALKPITFETLYGEDAPDFNGTSARGMNWLDDGQHYLHRRDGRLMKIDAATDAAEPAYDVDALLAALQAREEFDDKSAKRTAENPGRWFDDRRAVLIERDHAVYVYRFDDRKLIKLVDDQRERRELAIGPAGRYAGFIRDNDLYSLDLRNGHERRLTRGGAESTLNGVLDWVYQEEIYGRGNWRGFWIDNDDRYVAYLQLDESPVPVYTIVDQVPTRPPLEQTNYPKAGDPNPGVRVGVVRATGGWTKWIDLDRYEDAEILIMRVSWSPDGRLLLSVQDREQRWLDLVAADPRNGHSEVLIHEESPAWCNDIGHPHWLADGTFLWISERDGYKHLYHYDRDGHLLRRVTSGPWEVRELFGVGPQDIVYFRGTKDTPLELHLYSTPLHGGPVERLTPPGFNHVIDFDPTFTFYFDRYNSLTQPTRVELHRADTSLVRVLSDGDVPALKEYILSTPEIVQIPARDGFELTGIVLQPPTLDPSRRYPLWVEIYAGPGSQTVRNSWNPHGAMYDQMLAQLGYVVLSIDPRSGSGNGSLADWQAYQRLGQTELPDIEDAVQHFIDRGLVDPARVGITGYSYGGYMTTYALTHSTMFSVGVAGGPVTDWHNYDSVYTERYMRLPANNPAGYAAGSVVAAAEHLHGKLLIIHGLKDDNVHFQNAAQLIRALQQHKQHFDLMVYPLDRHGIWQGREHYRKLTYDYIRENL